MIELDQVAQSAQAKTKSRGQLAQYLLRLCVAVGAIATAVLLLLFGLTMWTLLALVFLIACPAVVIWALAISRRRNAPTHGRNQ